MKIFISWSGKRSKAIAETIREWLPDVIQGLQPWMSATDIEAGARWANDLIEQLNGTRFGILCLTPENLSAPWMLFEAGALSKTQTISRARVCPYLFQVEKSDIAGPLAQFQANLADEEGTLSIIRSLNLASETNALPEVQIEKQFRRCWPELEKSLKNIPGVTDQSDVRRSSEEILDEILGLVRNLSRSMAQRDKHELLSLLLGGKRPGRTLTRDDWSILQSRLTELAMEMFAETTADESAVNLARSKTDGES